MSEISSGMTVENSTVENYGKEDITRLTIPIIHEYESGLNFGNKRHIYSSDAGSFVPKGVKKEDLLDFIEIDDDELVYDVKQAVSPTSSRSLDNPDFGNVNIILSGNSSRIGGGCRKKVENEIESDKVDKLSHEANKSELKSELADLSDENVNVFDKDTDDDNNRINICGKRENEILELKSQNSEKMSIIGGEMYVDITNKCELKANVEYQENKSFKVDKLRDNITTSQKELSQNSQLQNNSKNSDEDNNIVTSSVDVGNLNNAQQSRIMPQIQMQLQSQQQSQFQSQNLVALCISTPPPYNGLPQNNPFFSSNGINEHINIVPFSTSPFFYLGFPEESSMNNNQLISVNNTMSGMSNLNIGGCVARGGMGVGVGIGMGIGVGGFGRGFFGGFGGINGISGVGAMGGNIGILSNKGIIQGGMGMTLSNNGIPTSGFACGDVETDVAGNSSILADLNVLSGGNGNVGGCKLIPTKNGNLIFRNQQLKYGDYSSNTTAKKTLQMGANNMDSNIKTGASLIQLDGYSNINVEYGNIASSLNGGYHQQQRLNFLHPNNDSGRYTSGRRGNSKSYSQTRAGGTSNNKLSNICNSNGNTGTEGLSLKEMSADCDGNILLSVNKAKSDSRAGSNLNGVNSNKSNSVEVGVPEKKGRWQLSDPQFKSGYKGVSWNSRMEAWLAFFVENGIRKSKTFSSRKFGFNRAREKAIRYLDARRKGIILTTPPPLSPSKGIYDRIPQQNKNASVNVSNTGDLLIGVENESLEEINYNNLMLDTSGIHPSASNSSSIISNIGINNTNQGVICTQLN
ncbi:hypothetical protein RS030_81471 [Cryptosporidium xiaoi]|uniref:AP2/ERF domain-containing protein n=1 Tax=Cryptosporidium xiaoi TaxID=659607 RepID=A0AAV9XVS7_9CRYT